MFDHSNQIVLNGPDLVKLSKPGDEIPYVLLLPPEIRTLLSLNASNKCWAKQRVVALTHLCRRRVVGAAFRTSVVSGLIVESKREGRRESPRGWTPLAFSQACHRARWSDHLRIQIHAFPVMPGSSRTGRPLYKSGYRKGWGKMGGLFEGVGHLL